MRIRIAPRISMGVVALILTKCAVGAPPLGPAPATDPTPAIPPEPRASARAGGSASEPRT